MIKINIVAVGKVKEKYFADAIAEYIKRLGKYVQVSVIETPEENYNKVDDALIKNILSKEAEKILPHLKGYVFAMAIEGKTKNSQEFASKIKGLIDKGEGVITFVIGGSYGLDEKIKDKSDELISFSPMTFPHTMFRVMLLEQTYRAFSIINGSLYHK